MAKKERFEANEPSLILDFIEYLLKTTKNFKYRFDSSSPDNFQLFKQTVIHIKPKIDFKSPPLNTSTIKKA